MIIKLPTQKKSKLKLRPELLLAPSIPLPLSQVNPRLIFGKDWWQRERRRVVKRNNYCCMACGVHARDAKEKQYLEGHEIFKISYSKKRSTYVEVAALCHHCHRVCHIKRLTLLADRGLVTRAALREVVVHGLAVLKKANLTPNYGLQYAELRMQGLPAAVIINRIGLGHSPRITPRDWNKWRMDYKGTMYEPKFKSLLALEHHYDSN